MAISVVQTTAVAAGTTSATTASITPTSGNILVAHVGIDTSAATPGTVTVTVTDSASGTWTTQIHADNLASGGNGGCAAIATCVPGNSTARTITASVTVGSGTVAVTELMVTEYTGQHASPIGASSGASTSAQTATAALTTGASSSAIALAANDWNQTGVPTSSDMTSTRTYNSAGNISGIFGTKVVGAAGAQTCNVVGGTSSAQWQVAMLEIKAAAGGGSSTDPTTSGGTVKGATARPTAAAIRTPWQQQDRRNAVLVASAANDWVPITGAYATRRRLNNSAVAVTRNPSVQPLQRTSPAVDLTTALWELPPNLYDLEMPSAAAKFWARRTWEPQQRRPLADQSVVAGTPFDPTQAGLLYVVTHPWMRPTVQPVTPRPWAAVDPVVQVGTGTLSIWWSDDDNQAHLAANRRVLQIPTIPVGVTSTGLVQAWWTEDDDRAHQAAQRRALIDQSTQPVGTPFDPTQAGPLDTPWRRDPIRGIQRIQFPVPAPTLPVTPTGLIQTWWTEDDDQAHQAAQRRAYTIFDNSVIVGAGTLIAWWGSDDTASFLGQRRYGLPPGGPNNYTQQLDDNAGLTDSLSITFNDQNTDSAGLTDSFSSVGSFNLAFTDTSGSTDSTALSFSPVILDQVAPSDSFAALAAHTATPTDVTGLVDSLVFAFSPVLTDTVGSTETLSTSALYSPSITDTSGLTDSFTSVGAFQVTQTDNAGLTDQTQTSGSGLQNQTDTAGLGDSLAFSISSVLTDTTGETDTSTVLHTIPLTISDVAGLTDSESESYQPVFTDLAGLSDTTATAQGYVLVLTDLAGNTDGPVFTISSVLTDVTGSTDTQSQLRSIAPTVTDTTGITDSFSSVSSFNLVFTDSAGLTDLASTGAFVNPTDIEGLADSLIWSYGPARSDVTGLTDALVTSASANQFDNAGLSDSISFTIGRTLVLTDAMGETDSLGLARNFTVTDLVGSTDSANPLLQGFGTVSPSDVLGLTDSMVLFSTQTLADDSGLTDQLLVSLLHSVVINDSMTATDLLYTGRTLTLTEALGLRDTQLLSRALVFTDREGLSDLFSSALVDTRILKDVNLSMDLSSRTWSHDTMPLAQNWLLDLEINIRETVL